jgi:hypothetical protein
MISQTVGKTTHIRYLKYDRGGMMTMTMTTAMTIALLMIFWRTYPKMMKVTGRNFHL